MFDFKTTAGLGTDTIDRSVLGPPFINMIQKGSPEFDETHTKFVDKNIPGCRPGNILFEPERLILAQPLEIIPLAQIPLYTEWKPNKGGFAGNHSADITQHPNYRKGVPGSPTQYREYLGQNELVYTITFLVLFLHDGKWQKGMIAFTSTQLKAARLWSKTIVTTKFPELPDVKPPIFAAVYNLTTFADSNSKGGYFSWRITLARMLNPNTDQALLEQAFAESKQASLTLPRPAAQAALVQSAATDLQLVDSPY